MADFQATGEAALGAVGGLGFGEGAIAGALIAGAAYLAGFVVFRRGAASVCALLMVFAAAVLEFRWLGLFSDAPGGILVFLQGLFCAAALLFLSATIRPARENPLLGAVMFAAALGFIGLGVVNFAGFGDASGAMRIGMVGVGVFAAGLSASQALRDGGARLILPGVLIALFAPVYAQYFSAGDAAGLIPHALFSFGVLAASLVALTEAPPARISELGLHAEEAGSFSAEREASPTESPERMMRVSENQLAQVLDYSGVAVWDWSPYGEHHTDGLPSLIGSDGASELSPQAVRALVHKDDLAKFDRKILASGEGDGAFDVALKLYDGRRLRLRGARAVDPSGAIERIVAFAESGADALKPGKEPVADAAAAAIGGALAAEPRSPGKQQSVLAQKFAAALEASEISVDFQPIVDLRTGAVAGYEALARWRAADGVERACAEDLVRAAEDSGKGGALARLVLKEAAARVAEHAKPKSGAPIFAAMNLSYSQLVEGGFADELRRARKEHSLPERSIVVELTESQAITDHAVAGRHFAELKQAGAALAFDDFGAGFTSLSNLQRYDFDYLKIDKSFIEKLADNKEGAKIARAIAALGRDLGLTVIAEGVETPDAASAAKEIGCDMGQGYAFGAPASREEESASRKSRKRFWSNELR